MKPVITPCIAVCTIDERTQMCIGCLRTRDEIARWTAMNDTERDAVMKALAGRKMSDDAARY